MIKEFESEFSGIATEIGAEFKVLAVDELQDFAQGYTFPMPLINFVPIESFDSNIGASGEMVWTGRVVLQFLTKAEVMSEETVKDFLIDDMINLSSDFFRSLHNNTNRVFRNPTWSMSSRVLRFKTANYCVGVETTIKFQTSCNRI